MTLWCESGNIKRIMNIPPEKIIIFDTETTGLDEEEDEILQLAIIDGSRTILFNEYIKPIQKTSWRKAQAIHHITPAKVKDKPNFYFYKEQVKKIFQQADLLIGYNLEFDLKFLKAEGIVPPREALIFDVMKEFAPVYGCWSNYFADYRWTTLTDCAEYYDYEYSAHDALADCKATLYCFHCMLNDNSPSGYLAICEKCKGKSLYSLHEQIKKERFFEWLMTAKIEATNEPIFDEIDKDIYSCYIVGMQYVKENYKEYKQQEVSLFKSTFDSIEKLCREKGGRLYKSYAKGVKWVIVLQASTCSLYEKNKSLHTKGYKVARWSEFLEYIGLDNYWDLESWREEYERNRQLYVDEYERRLRIVKDYGYKPELEITTNNDTSRTVEKPEVKEDSLEKGNIGHQESFIKPSVIYRKICDEIEAQKITDNKCISIVASKACLYGKDTAWLYFAIRNDMALGLIYCSDDNFCKAHQKFFPEMSKEMLLLRRRQATQWINDPNVFRNQIQMLFKTPFEERYTMLVKNYLGRIDPVDPSQHTNNAFVFLQNFFNPDEQQILWHYIWNDLASKKQKALERLSMVNVEFGSFQLAKKNLSIFVENPKYLDLESFNPYDYLSKDVYFYVALSDTRDKDLCIKLKPDQAWLWETSIENIYKVAIQNLQDKREEGNDAELMIRRLLPQYFK